MRPTDELRRKIEVPEPTEISVTPKIVIERIDSNYVVVSVALIDPETGKALWDFGMQSLAPGSSITIDGMESKVKIEWRGP